MCREYVCRNICEQALEPVTQFEVTADHPVGCIEVNCILCELRPSCTVLLATVLPQESYERPLKQGYTGHVNWSTARLSGQGSL